MDPILYVHDLVTYRQNEPGRAYYTETPTGWSATPEWLVPPEVQFWFTNAWISSARISTDPVAPPTEPVIGEIMPNGHDPDAVDAWYDGDGGGGIPVQPVQLASVGTALSLLISRHGAWLYQLLRQAGVSLAVGARIRWTSLPQWVRFALVAIGVDQGIDILVDTGEGDSGIIGDGHDVGGGMPYHGLPSDSLLASGAIVQIGVRTYTVASSWLANGVRFYRFRDGNMGVVNKHGVWSVWRPQKPIVLFADGAKDLKVLIRADKAIDKQSGKVAKVLRGRGYEVRKHPKKEEPKK